MGDLEMVEAQVAKVMPLVRSKIPVTDVDDVLQDIRLALFVSLPSFKGESSLSTFGYSIAKHKIVDYWRGETVRRKEVRAAMEKAREIPRENPGVKGNGVSLTPAEKSVFRLLGEGATNGEIAEALSVSLSTVRSHLKNVYAKLGHCRRAKAALLSYKVFYESERVKQCP